MNSKLYLIADKNTQVACFKFSYSSSWSCSIERKADGVELKVQKDGATLEEAVDLAITAFERIASPIKEFSGALLEHQPSPSSALDDDIPF